MSILQSTLNSSAASEPSTTVYRILNFKNLVKFVNAQL